MSVLFATIGQVSKWSDSAEYLVPIDPVDDFSDLGRRSAGRVHAANQASHAGPDDIAYRNAMLFHPRYDADMGETERAAALEDKAELWMHGCVVLWRLLSIAAPAEGQNR